MICILTIVRYSKKLSLFGIMSMALFHPFLYLNKNIHFYKLLGCGKNGTFDIHPDWQQWGILTVRQKSDVDLKQSTNSKLYGKFIAKWFRVFNCEVFTVIMQPIEGFGRWDGKEIFGKLPKQTDYQNITAVLTRATIRFSRLKAFWKNVSGVANQMADSPGFITSVGIGEIPLIKQATFSVWETKDAMKQFSYRMQPHVDVIRKTRAENWYSEELFVRFIPLAAYGTLQGKNPLQSFLKDDAEENQFYGFTQVKSTSK